MPHSYDEYLDYIEMDFDWDYYDSWDAAADALMEQYNETFVSMYEGELEQYYTEQ